MGVVRRVRDVNMETASALYDMALVHAADQRKFAYKRAARSVLRLEQPLSEIVKAGRVRDIPYIGPASERVILEILEEGRSPTVERAIARSGREADITAAHKLRSNFLSRAAVLRILRSRTRGVVSLPDYRGDLQMHTEWSDGAEAVEQMADAAMARGHQYACITDHSYGLKIAGGMTMGEVVAQHREIDALNRRLEGRFRIVKGIEANLRTDGTVDMTPEELGQFELVVAAPHSALRKSHDQTERMVTAVRQPVHVIGHPRGRMYSRQGILANWDAVFEEAAGRDVAVEIDGDYYRQDLDHTLARRALRAGCWFALDSDAHSGAELVYSEYALAHARLAGIPPERVINCWPVERLLAWAGERKR